MKFAHSFAETLEKERFPPEWIAAAIRYRELKKCIKRVQEELAGLGLDSETLRCLVAEQSRIQGEGEGGQDGHQGPTARYTFDGTVESFRPKLILTIGREGIPLEMGISEETRNSLGRLMVNRTVHPLSEPEVPPSLSPEPRESPSLVQHGSHTYTIAIPLYADSEFFHHLTEELSSLEGIQTQAQAAIEAEIQNLGTAVTIVAKPTKLDSRSDLYQWREIFRAYLDSDIFVSNREIERNHERDADEAQRRLLWFYDEMERLGLGKKFKKQGSQLLLRRFIAINEEMLRVLRFQTINKIAMNKILKKFDKRTALGARETFPTFVASNPFLAYHLTKALCFTMSSHLLNHIPQLEDYLCPICSSIAVKPVRLSCSHLFCVRCLVRLQRENKRNCPMCRDDVVMHADSANLDLSLLNFLKGYFPKEAKEKQRENEMEVAKEQWSNIHTDDMKEGAGCVLM